MVQTIQQQIDHWRRVQRERLRQDEAADDGYAERTTQFRTGTGGDGERYRAEQCRHGGHQDRTEALETGLEDCTFGRQTALTFALQREVNQHDSVLLDDTD